MKTTSGIKYEFRYAFKFKNNDKWFVTDGYYEDTEQFEEREPCTRFYSIYEKLEWTKREIDHSRGFDEFSKELCDIETKMLHSVEIKGE